MAKHEELTEILERFDNAMLISQEPNGSLGARPMHIVDQSQFPTLTLIAEENSGTVAEIDRNPQVALTLQGDSRYIAVSGLAHIDRSTDRLKDHWSRMTDLWFEGGPESGNATLIDIEVTAAEYWDISGKNRLRFMIEAGKALLSDKTIDVDSLEGNGTYRRTGTDSA